MSRAPSTRPRLRLLGLIAFALCVGAITGCAVVSVAGTAVSVGVGAAGIAAGAAVGAVKLTGKAVGATVDALSDDDNSGLNVRFREPTAADREKRRLAEKQAEEYDRQQAEAQRVQQAPPYRPDATASEASTHGVGAPNPIEGAPLAPVGSPSSPVAP